MLAHVIKIEDMMCTVIFNVFTIRYAGSPAQAWTSTVFSVILFVLQVYVLLCHVNFHTGICLIKAIVPHMDLDHILAFGSNRSFNNIFYWRWVPSGFLHGVHAGLCHCHILKLGLCWYMGVLVPIWVFSLRVFLLRRAAGHLLCGGVFIYNDPSVPQQWPPPMWDLPPEAERDSMTNCHAKFCPTPPLSQKVHQSCPYLTLLLLWVFPVPA